jgi:hypothetical protein
MQALVLLLALALRTTAAPVATDQPTPTRTFAISGSLYGPTTLRGYDPSLPFSTEDTTIPEGQIVYAPDQASDTIGESFDFSDVPTPQPIRGTKGGTDPGPKQPEIDRTHPDILAPPQSDHGMWPVETKRDMNGTDETKVMCRSSTGQWT